MITLSSLRLYSNMRLPCAWNMAAVALTIFALSHSIWIAAAEKNNACDPALVSTERVVNMFGLGATASVLIAKPAGPAGTRQNYFLCYARPTGQGRPTSDILCFQGSMDELQTTQAQLVRSVDGLVTRFEAFAVGGSQYVVTIAENQGPQLYEVVERGTIVFNPVHAIGGVGATDLTVVTSGPAEVVMAMSSGRQCQEGDIVCAHPAVFTLNGDTMTQCSQFNLRPAELLTGWSHGGSTYFIFASPTVENPLFYRLNLFRLVIKPAGDCGLDPVQEISFGRPICGLRSLEMVQSTDPANYGKFVLLAASGACPNPPHPEGTNILFQVWDPATQHFSEPNGEIAGTAVVTKITSVSDQFFICQKLSEPSTVHLPQLPTSAAVVSTVRINNRATISSVQASNGDIFLTHVTSTGAVVVDWLSCLINQRPTNYSLTSYLGRPETGFPIDNASPVVASTPLVIPGLDPAANTSQKFASPVTLTGLVNSGNREIPVVPYGQPPNNGTTEQVPQVPFPPNPTVAMGDPHYPQPPPMTLLQSVITGEGSGFVPPHMPPKDPNEPGFQHAFQLNPVPAPQPQLNPGLAQSPNQNSGFPPQPQQQNPASVPPSYQPVLQQPGFMSNPWQMQMEQYRGPTGVTPPNYGYPFVPTPGYYPGQPMNILRMMPDQNPMSAGIPGYYPIQSYAVYTPAQPFFSAGGSQYSFPPDSRMPQSGTSTNQQPPQQPQQFQFQPSLPFQVPTTYWSPSQPPWTDLHYRPSQTAPQLQAGPVESYSGPQSVPADPRQGPPPVPDPNVTPFQQPPHLYPPHDTPNNVVVLNPALIPVQHPLMPNPWPVDTRIPIPFYGYSHQVPPTDPQPVTTEPTPTSSTTAHPDLVIVKMIPFNSTMMSASSDVPTLPRTSPWTAEGEIATSSSPAALEPSDWTTTRSTEPVSPWDNPETQHQITELTSTSNWLATAGVGAGVSTDEHGAPETSTTADHGRLTTDNLRTLVATTTNIT